MVALATGRSNVAMARYRLSGASAEDSLRICIHGGINEPVKLPDGKIGQQQISGRA
jgi:hypothetical protein